MQKISETIRNKIKLMIKNRQDLSEILKPYSLKGEDLTRAIIKEFNRPNDDMSYVNLTQAIIGEKGKIIHLSGAILYGANFKDATFLGKLWIRHCDARHSTWDGAYAPLCEYQKIDLRGASMCNASWRIGSQCGVGTKVSESLIKKWGLIICKDEENNDTKTS